jgi:phage antirepressor YoqD-like protein
MSACLPTLSKVAKQLNIGPRKLLAYLRHCKIIDADNYAMPKYIHLGYFKVEQRSYINKNNQCARPYFVTTVTDKGLFFLQGVANELRGSAKLHGSDGADRATAERDTAVLPGSDRVRFVRRVPS